MPSENDLDEGENETTRKGQDKGEKKDESRGIFRGFGRIKGALRRNATFAKKDKEGGKNGEAVKEDLNNDYENNNKGSPSSSEIYDVQVIRKTTAVKVNKKLPVDLDMKSNLLHDILGIISGLDLDPVQPVLDSVDDTVISRRLDAIAIQGIVSGSPVDVNQDINIGK